MDNTGAGVIEGEETTGEVRMGVAFQIEYDRFGPAFHPDCAAHDTFGAVVDLAADYVVMNSEGHVRDRGYQKTANLVEFYCKHRLQVSIGGRASANGFARKLAQGLLLERGLEVGQRTVFALFSCVPCSKPQRSDMLRYGRSWIGEFTKFQVPLVVMVLAFAPPVQAQETASEDPDERVHFTEKDLPSREKDPAGPSEIEEFARERGFNYAADTRRAARGDTKALKQFFSIAHDADGAAAESIAGMPAVVYHLLGDEKFAKFLVAQPLAYRMMVRSLVVGEGVTPHRGEYLRRHFPQTAELLFRREMVDWISPNGLYAIRKVFTDELPLASSKVVRAELIEKKSGRVLYDLTQDDIGTGAQREGEAVWSPDSKRVACLSSDLTEQQGNLFSTPRPAPLRKQTGVYQLTGETFSRLELPLGEVPGRASDTELDGAVLGHEYTEPVRWQKPNILELERHEYYQKMMPTTVGNQRFDSIHDLSRWYRITATIDPDGKASLVWKLRKY